MLAVGSQHHDRQIRILAQQVTAEPRYVGLSRAQNHRVRPRLLYHHQQLELLLRFAYYFDVRLERDDIANRDLCSNPENDPDPFHGISEGRGTDDTYGPGAIQWIPVLHSGP